MKLKPVMAYFAVIIMQHESETIKHIYMYIGLGENFASRYLHEQKK